MAASMPIRAPIAKSLLSSMVFAGHLAKERHPSVEFTFH
jgi:hypothetical protein